jgi:excisionase family DNA binding protein
MERLVPMEGSPIIFENMIGIEELCQILQLKRSYIYLLTHQRQIPHYKVKGHLRFRLSEIEEWLSRHSVEEKDVKNIDF